MGWVALALVGGVAFAAMALLGIGRRLWSFAGAALMLGAAGYAWQGRPMLPASPARPSANMAAEDPEIMALRDRMLGRFGADGAYLAAADAMERSGDRRSAVRVLIGGINAVPESVLLWTALGSAYAAHDGGQLSPPALFAFRRALQLSPAHPAPPFFLGLAYAQAGEFAKARPWWQHALALAPARASYRQEIAIRLALLDQYLAMTGNGAAPR